MRDQYGRLVPKADELKKQYDKAFQIRKQAIQDLAGRKVPELEAELNLVNHDMVFIQTGALKDLINRDNIDTIFLINRTNDQRQ